MLSGLSRIKSAADAQILPIIKHIDAVNGLIPVDMGVFKLANKSIGLSVPVIPGVTGAISIDFKKLLELSLHYGYVGVFSKLLEFSFANGKIKIDFNLIKENFKQAISVCAAYGHLKLADGLIDCALLNTNLRYDEKRELLEYKARYASVKVGDETYVVLQTTQHASNPFRLNIETFILEQSAASETKKEDAKNSTTSLFYVPKMITTAFKRKRADKTEPNSDEPSGLSTLTENVANAAPASASVFEQAPVAKKPRQGAKRV